MSSRRETAEFLLGQGLALTPLRHNSKAPATPAWQTGEGAVRCLKDLNGQDYGAMIWERILGIDIDVKNVDGIANFNRLLDGLELPKTLRAKTGSGGMHLYFRLSEDSEFKGPIKVDHLGIEVYTDGRQFCAIKDGYEFELNEIEEAPFELIERLESLRTVHPATEKQDLGRNTAMIAKVGAWIGMGLDDFDVGQLAREENEKFDVPLPVDELIGLVDRACDRYPQGSLLQDWYLAKAIADLNKESLRYCIEQKLFYVKGDTRWEPDPTHGLVTELINRARSKWIAAASKKPDRAKALIKRLLDLGNVSRRKSVIEDLSRQSIIQVSASEMDCDQFILGCRNGWIDCSVDEPKFHDGSPDSFVTKSLNAIFDPEAESPVWEAALKVWFPDDEVRAFMQRLSGYILAGGNEREIVAFLQGPAASGKSKFTSALLQVFGDYGVAIRVETITDRRRSAAGASEDLARLAGVRLAVTDEPAQGMRFNEALVKSLAGRDRINARALYQGSFDFDSRLVLVIHSNFDLYASSDDSGFWRRMLKVPFVFKIAPKDRDPKLLSKLIEESDGILQWIIAGWVEYEEKGLAVPTEIREASQKYRTSFDLVGDFLNEDCVRFDQLKEVAVETGGELKYPGLQASDVRVRSTVLWKAFKSWCARSCRDVPLSKQSFEQKLRAKGFEDETDSGKVRRWLEIELRSTREM